MALPSATSLDSITLVSAREHWLHFIRFPFFSPFTPANLLAAKPLASWLLGYFRLGLLRYFCGSIQIQPQKCPHVRTGTSSSVNTEASHLQAGSNSESLVI